MKSIIFNIKYQGKNMYRDKEFVFWAVLYPLIMAVFFYIAFNGIINREFTNIDIGISENNRYNLILEEVDILNIHKIKDNEINKKLIEEEIDAYIGEDLELTVKESGINQTIVKEVLDEIRQIVKLNLPFERFDFEADFLKDRDQDIDGILVVFYSLIAMVSVFSVFPGITIANMIKANLSHLAERLNITPLRKGDFIISGIIIGLSLNLISNALLLIFINYVLRLNLITNIKYTFLYLVLGNLFGIVLGITIGSVSKAAENTKVMISIVITLALSFFAGLMSPNIKVLIDEKAPIINKLNPISIVTNNLYRINLLNSKDTIYTGALILTAICFILASISYIFLRSEKYDSL